MNKRQEDFIDAGIAYRMEHGKPMCIAGSNLADVERDLNRVMSFEAGAEHGYQYAQTHPNWISVEEELPKEQGKYMFRLSNGDMYYETYYPKLKLMGNVTHWMPIVPPRKEE